MLSEQRQQKEEEEEALSLNCFLELAVNKTDFD